MAEFDRELREIFEGIGTDIRALRKSLTGTTKSILDNAKANKTHTSVQKMLIAQQEQTRKLLKDSNQLTEEQNEQIDANIDAIKKHTEKTETARKGTMTFGGVMMKAVKVLGKLILGAAEIGANFGRTSSSIKNFTDAVDAGFDNIPYLGAGLKKLAPEIDDNVQLFRGLANSGASFGSSITSLRMAAFEAGMPLLQFQELIQNNTTTLARLFGSVQEGIPQFVGLGRSLRNFTEQELAKFGVTVDDTNEFLTTFAELERARGRAGQLSQAELLAGTKEYAKNLVLLSKLTGESVQELDQRNRQLAADGVFQAKLAQMDEEQAERVRQALQLLPDSAQQAAKEIIGLGVPISDAGRGLQVLSQGRFGDTLRSLIDGTETDLLAASNVFKEVGTDIIKTGDAAASAALAGNPMFTEVLNIATQLAGVAADRESVERELIASQQDNIVAAVNMTSALERNTTELQALGTTLLNDTLFAKGSPLGQALEKFVDNPTTVAEKLTSGIEGMIKFFKNSRGTGDPDYYGAGLQTGTNGFVNFGSGTPVVLHGMEAVVPKTDIGQMATVLSEAGAVTTNNTNTTTGDSVTTNNTSIDMSRMNANTEQLIALNEKVANHLNTLVTIGAMTEKNTKKFNNTLANMGGSLV